jgi:hypothetical protein
MMFVEDGVDLLQSRPTVDTRATGDAVDEAVGALGLDEPGATLLTRPPWGATSLASPLLYVVRAAFAAA